MHPLLILAVVAVAVMSESAPAEPTHAPLSRILALAAVTMFVVSTATLIAVPSARGVYRDPWRRRGWLKRFRRAKEWHQTVWLCAIPAMIVQLRWPQVVRYDLGLEGTLLIDELLILAPLIVPLLLSWLAFYEVEYAVERLEAAAVGEATPARKPAPFILQCARVNLALVLIPLVALFAAEDLADLIHPAWRDGMASNALYLGYLILLLSVFPVILRYTWPTAPLPAGPLRDRLEAASRHCRLAVRGFLVWETDGRVVNAAVTGIWSLTRYVFLTDGLLDLLSDEEVEAVVLHEAAHIRRGHLPLRIGTLILPLFFWYALSRAFSMPPLAFAGGQELNAASVLLVGGTVLWLVVGLGWYCRLLEHDADLWACCRCLNKAGGETDAANRFLMAMEKLARESGVVRHRSGWLHPSWPRRLELVRRAVHDERFLRRFQQKVELTNGMLLAGLLALAAVCCLC